MPCNVINFVAGLIFVFFEMSNKRKWVFISAGVVCAAVVVVGLIYCGFPLAGKSATIRIPRAATCQMVCDTLTKYLGERYAVRVLSMASFMGMKLEERAGAFRISRGTMPWRAAWNIGRGRQEPVRLTINNLRTRDDILRFLDAKLECDTVGISAVLNDKTLMARYNLTPATATALFLNNTYEVFWNVTPANLIEKLGKHYNDFWNEKRRGKAEALGLTPSQVIIISSIAEEESAKSDERGRIGRLYINRLQKGMRLQADPTVRFALNDFTIKRVGKFMLQNPSPYNTYRVEGLPPGPIRTVDEVTIDAILDSEQSNDLYMCARPDFSGYHNFSDSYSEHSRNAMEYQRELNRRGIRNDDASSSHK